MDDFLKLLSWLKDNPGVEVKFKHYDNGNNQAFWKTTVIPRVTQNSSIILFDDDLDILRKEKCFGEPVRSDFG